MLRELSNQEQSWVSGGQTSEEVSIGNFLNTSGTVTASNIYNGYKWSFNSGGMTGIDFDGNGFYDYVFHPEYGTWDPSTGQWGPEDIEAQSAVTTDSKWMAAFQDHSFETPNNVDE